MRAWRTPKQPVKRDIPSMIRTARRYTAKLRPGKPPARQSVAVTGYTFAPARGNPMTLWGSSIRGSALRWMKRHLVSGCTSKWPVSVLAICTRIMLCMITRHPMSGGKPSVPLSALALMSTCALAREPAMTVTESWAEETGLRWTEKHLDLGHTSKSASTAGIELAGFPVSMSDETEKTLAIAIK